MRLALDETNQLTTCDQVYRDDKLGSGESSQQVINLEYLEFIEQTRRHQLEREKAKKKELAEKLSSQSDEYYLDISQVNTLVEDNLVEPPQLDEPEIERREQSPLEMYIDEQFRLKCGELRPSYWPAVPINLKPYLQDATRRKQLHVTPDK